MIASILKTGLSLATLSLTVAVLAEGSPTVWDGSIVGECLPIRRDVAGRVDQFGAMTRQEFGQPRSWPRYIMIWDATPGSNPTRSLLRQTRDKKECVIGFFPFADTHDFKLLPSGKVSDKITTSTSPMANSDGESESIDIEYEFDARVGLYSEFPTHCFKKKSGARAEIKCSDAF